MIMSVPQVFGGLLWTFFAGIAAIGAAVALLEVSQYLSEVARRRLVLAFVFSLVLSAPIFADVITDYIISNPCRGVEAYSFEWWMRGCWAL